MVGLDRGPCSKSEQAESIVGYPEGLHFFLLVAEYAPVRKYYF